MKYKFIFIKKFIYMLFVFLPLFSMNAFAENNYQLTDQESTILMQYFTGIHNYSDSPEKNIELYNRKYEVFDKIIGGASVKTKDQIKMYISLMQMVYTNFDNSENDYIVNGLYDRYILQPKDYFLQIKRHPVKIAPFCHYLGRSFFGYIVRNRIKPSTKKLRQFFLLKHSLELSVFASDDLIDKCLTSMKDSSFEAYLNDYDKLIKQKK